MKKRLGALVLALWLALACALPAGAAAGFDEQVLKKAQDIAYYIYPNENRSTYSVLSLLDDERWYWTADGTDALLVYPCVVAEEDRETFNLCFLYDARAALKLQNAYVEVDGTYYVFRGLDNDVDWYDGGADEWWISELACIELDADSLAVLDAIVAHRDESIQIGLQGENEYIGITLGQPEINGIIHLYNLYCLAGGLRAENLQKMPGGTGTEFSIRELAV